MLSAWLCLAVGCVDLTEPWNQGGLQTGGHTGTATTGVLPESGTGGRLGMGTGGLANTMPRDDAAPDRASPVDGAGIPPTNTGGVSGAGGSTAADASIASDGSGASSGRLDGTTLTGTGGNTSGLDGAMADSPLAGGSSGTRDASGAGATGGLTAGIGGSVSTGGSVGTGGSGTGGSGTGGSVGTGGSGTGGSVGTGGSGTGGSGTGGTTVITRLPYDCANAVSPFSGIVTNFADWNETTRTWGTISGLYGSIFSYADPNASFDTAKVEGSPKALHLKGTVSGGYGGGGLSLWVCTTVAGFTAIQFDIYGSGPGCAVQMQIQLFDQRPVDQNPPGGCVAGGGTECFRSPALNDIVDISSAAIPSASPRTVSKALSSFTDNTSWSVASAVQVVGLQWQFTGSSCSADVYITNVKFTKP